MAKIDVYRDWLKIEATNRPLNYYQILRLKNFEDDVHVIRKHYRELNAHIRKYATGEYIEESQNLLNELAKAMLCLTDSERKKEYDFSLGRKEPEREATTGRRTFSEILQENRVLSPEQLKKAEKYADAVGIGLEMAILQQKQADPEAVMLAYAESEGLPFVNLDEFPVDEFYAPQIDPVMARQHSFVPVMADMGRLIMASPAPLDLDLQEQLQVQLEMPVRCAICTPVQINAAIAKYYPRDAVQVIVKKSGTAAPAAGQAQNAAPAQVQEKKKKAAEPRKPLSPEAKKNRLKLSVVFFNFSFMLTVFVRYFMTNGKLTVANTIAGGLVVAAIVGAITWFVTSKELPEQEE